MANGRRTDPRDRDRGLSFREEEIPFGDSFGAFGIPSQAELDELTRSEIAAAERQGIPAPAATFVDPIEVRPSRTDGTGSFADPFRNLRDIGSFVGGAVGQGARAAQTTRDRLDAFRRAQDEARRRAQSRAAGRAAAAFNARIARINEAIEDTRADAAFARQQYGQFIDSIAPGFEEAIAVARDTGAAQAAINAVFEETGQAIDARYASTAGRVRAISDQVSGNDADVAEALNESVFEFKTFIDEGLHLDRSNSINMFKAASALAAAAAEAEHRGIEGETGREQFVTQKRYEKIIEDLLKDRAEAQAAKARAVAAAREQAAARFARNTPASFADFREFAGRTYLQEADIPPSKAGAVLDVMEDMYDLGVPSFNAFLTDQVTRFDAGEPTLYTPRDLELVAEFENVIEVGVIAEATFEANYNDSVTNPTPGDPYDQFLSSVFTARFGGADEREARDFAALTLEELGL